MIWKSIETLLMYELRKWWFPVYQFKAYGV
jgi:hypothetical protein